MKRILSLFLLALSLLFTQEIAAQRKTFTPYLFDKFEDAYVTTKDAKRFAVKINYDLVTKKFMFIESPDLIVQEFLNPNDIALIKVGERIFLPEIGKAVEIIQHDPQFHVLYTAKLRNAPREISYGGTSETASVDNFSRLSGVGVTSGTHVNRKVVSEIIKTYNIKIKNKNKSFYNKASFLKQFPKEIRDILSSYIDEKTIDFDSVEQVLTLFNYAISLIYRK